MVKFLANENMPSAAVEAARQAGVDFTWVRDISPGISDEAVLTLSQTEGRVLLMFDITSARKKRTELWRHVSNVPEKERHIGNVPPQRHEHLPGRDNKDFGEMAFEPGKTATSGVILLRPRLRSPEDVAQFTVALLAQPIDWIGSFSVAQEERLRVVPLPD